MRCIKCNKKLQKNSRTCRLCGYEMTPDEFSIQSEKHKNEKRTRRIIIFSIIGVLVLGFAYLAIALSSIEGVSCENSIYEYDDDVTYSVEFNCPSANINGGSCDMYAFLDGDLIESDSVKLKRGETKYLEYIIYSNMLSVGTHTLEICEFDDNEDSLFITFEVLSEPEIYLYYDYPKDCFATNKEYEIEYSFANEGESGTQFEHVVKFNGKEIQSESDYIESGDEVKYKCNIKADSSGDYTLSIDGHEYAIYMFDTLDPENGYEVIYNTVKGYSSFEIKNELGMDFIIYVYKEMENGDEELVGARLIKEGKEHEFKSFDHGTYYISIMTGENYSPQLLEYVDNPEEYISIGGITFKNNVYGGVGSYQYMELTVDKQLLLESFEKLDEYYEQEEQSEIAA